MQHIDVDTSLLTLGLLAPYATGAPYTPQTALAVLAAADMWHGDPRCGAAPEDASLLVVTAAQIADAAQSGVPADLCPCPLRSTDQTLIDWAGAHREHALYLEAAERLLADLDPCLPNERAYPVDTISATDFAQLLGLLRTAAGLDRAPDPGIRHAVAAATARLRHLHRRLDTSQRPSPALVLDSPGHWAAHTLATAVWRPASGTGWAPHLLGDPHAYRAVLDAANDLVRSAAAYGDSGSAVGARPSLRVMLRVDEHPSDGPGPLGGCRRSYADGPLDRIHGLFHTWLTALTRAPERIVAVEYPQLAVGSGRLQRRRGGPRDCELYRHPHLAALTLPSADGARVPGLLLRVPAAVVLGQHASRELVVYDLAPAGIPVTAAQAEVAVALLTAPDSVFTGPSAGTAAYAVALGITA